MRLLDIAPKRKQQMIIFTVALASFMGALDSTIVNISLPTISRYFDVSLGLVSWVLLIYLLFMSSFLLAFGKLGDIIGFRKILLWGFAVFSLGSFLCGITPSFELLLAFRVVQAIGGAMLISVGPAVVTTMLPPEIHGRALGYVGTLFSLGIALGPVLGGYLTAYLSWRWIFFGINELLENI